MLYREIIAVCSGIHTKHINTLCGQNVELLNVKLVVHIVTTGLYRVSATEPSHCDAVPQYPPVSALSLMEHTCRALCHVKTDDLNTYWELSL